MDKSGAVSTEEFNFKQPYVVTAALIEKDGKILMVKESRGPYEGKWNLPAGRWDREEDLIKCVKREALEETGYEFNPEYIIGFYTSINLTKHAAVFKVVYSGKSKNKPHDLSEDISETRYFTPEEITKMGSSLLMNINILTVIEDYKNGKRYPLDMVDFVKI